MKKEEAKKLADRALSDLEQALKAGHSEALMRYLDLMSRFHTYSFCNCMLIALQMPTATFVAGFRRWLQLGRHVRKGEKGIGIIAPMVYRPKKEDAAESQDDAGPSLYGFKVVHVFDVNQTDGDELPQLGAIQGDPGELLFAMERLVRDSGIALVYEQLPYGSDGISRKGEIVVAEGLAEAEIFAVLAHELAHEWMHDQKQRQHLSKTVRETEAEAVAYVVCQAFGFDCSTRSSDYIQIYRGSAETLNESLDRIQKTATRIIETLPRDSVTAEEESQPMSLAAQSGANVVSTTHTITQEGTYGPDAMLS